MDSAMEDQDRRLYDSVSEIFDSPLVSKALDNYRRSTDFSSSDGISTSQSSEICSLDLTARDESKSDTNPSPAKNCTCREGVEWKWEDRIKSRFVQVVNDNFDVKFHKTRRSHGTAVARCSEPMSNNQYYFEIKMAYPVYGTDVMVGIGTSDADLKDKENKFVSRLGMDSQTWGLSYTGLFHHNGKRQWYAKSFGQGSVIGVHLDLWRGILSFYKDRQHLGVASTNLKGKTFYAMASSTAAKSGVRIVKSTSFPSSLQFLCCAKLRELIPDDKDVLDVINIPLGLKNYLQSKLSWLLSKRYIDSSLPLCCPLVESKSDDEDNVDDGYTPFGGPYQYLLIGTVLMGNCNTYDLDSLRRRAELDFSPENMAKRLRRSFAMD